MFARACCGGTCPVAKMSSFWTRSTSSLAGAIWSKGFYDTQGDRVALLVTGSARLDHYRKGGDSLQGRYHHYRLHPFSLNELVADPSPNDLEALLQFGGFPEPLLAGNVRTWRRCSGRGWCEWCMMTCATSKTCARSPWVELLVEALPSRVGSPLSIRSLSEDLQVAHQNCGALVEHPREPLRLLPHSAVWRTSDTRREKREQALPVGLVAGAG